MWTSMKHKKRCIVVAQGFYEWQNKGSEKARVLQSSVLAASLTEFTSRSHTLSSERTGNYSAWPVSGTVSNTKVPPLSPPLILAMNLH